MNTCTVCRRIKTHSNIPMVLVVFSLIVLFTLRGVPFKLSPKININHKKLTILLGMRKKMPMKCFDLSLRASDFKRRCFTFSMLLIRRHISNEILFLNFKIIIFIKVNTCWKHMFYAMYQKRGDFSYDQYKSKCQNYNLLTSIGLAKAFRPREPQW